MYHLTSANCEVKLWWFEFSKMCTFQWTLLSHFGVYLKILFANFTRGLWYRVTYPFLLPYMICLFDVRSINNIMTWVDVGLCVSVSFLCLLDPSRFKAPYIMPHTYLMRFSCHSVYKFCMMPLGIASIASSIFFLKYGYFYVGMTHSTYWWHNPLWIMMRPWSSHIAQLLWIKPQASWDFSLHGNNINDNCRHALLSEIILLLLPEMLRKHFVDPVI